MCRRQQLLSLVFLKGEAPTRLTLKVGLLGRDYEKKRGNKVTMSPFSQAKLGFDRRGQTSCDASGAGDCFLPPY